MKKKQRSLRNRDYKLIIFWNMKRIIFHKKGKDKIKFKRIHLLQD